MPYIFQPGFVSEVGNWNIAIKSQAKVILILALKINEIYNETVKKGDN